MTLQKASLFQPGDVVRLGSDGPKMTVSKVNDDTIAVVWFEGTFLQRALFRPSMLVLVREARSGDGA